MLQVDAPRPRYDKKGLRSTYTFLLYLSDCSMGGVFPLQVVQSTGETTFLEALEGDVQHLGVQKALTEAEAGAEWRCGRWRPCYRGHGEPNAWPLAADAARMPPPGSSSDRSAQGLGTGRGHLRG